MYITASVAFFWHFYLWIPEHWTTINHLEQQCLTDGHIVCKHQGLAKTFWWMLKCKRKSPCIDHLRYGKLLTHEHFMHLCTGWSHFIRSALKRWMLMQAACIITQMSSICVAKSNMSLRLHARCLNRFSFPFILWIIWRNHRSEFWFSSVKMVWCQDTSFSILLVICFIMRTMLKLMLNFCYLEITVTCLLVVLFDVNEIYF